jgi:hypothetical protein
MISNRGILALEDPFKGLEREEANVVADALKKEAMTGKTILASVGENDTKLLSRFDRLIVLSQTDQIYNDKTSKVNEHLEQNNISYTKQSPIDVLMNIVSQAPTPIANSVKQDQDTNGTVHIWDRDIVSWKTTFCMLYMRNFHMYVRNVRNTTF